MPDTTGGENRETVATAGMSDPGETLHYGMNRRGGSPVLVGRAAELAALQAAFDAVRQGGPAALLIGGEAGVGKTRLISEFAGDVRAAGARVLIGGCLELGADGLPFGPFTAMLRDLVREIGADELIGLLPGSDRATRELARLLPELAAGRPAGEAGSAGEARARLFEEFLTLLERLAVQQPLVLVVEDAHWADRSSRDLIAFLIGYQRALANVLIVVTFRSDELHRTHPLRPLLAELTRIDWVERAELPRLSRGQAEELAAAVMGAFPDRALTDALYERAEGNPLFTEELLACPDGCALIPDSLVDLLQQAVRRLPEDTQEVLRIASAGSGATSHPLLARVTGRTEDALTAAIRPAVTGNVLVTTADGYAFRHALIREAVHEDLLPGEHSQVHTKFALAIDADPALVGDGRADMEKAHHWYAAHNTTWALISAWQASVQASRSVAHAERLVLLARVLELWDQVPDAAERVGADQVRVALLLSQRHLFRKDLGLPEDMKDLHRALELVPEALSKQARIQLLLAASQYSCHTGGEQFAGWGEDALRLARELGDRDAEAQALTALAGIKAGPLGLAEPGGESFRLIAQARRIAEEIGAYQPIIKLVIYESHLLCGAGEYERAAAVAREGIADAERHGLARTRGAFLAINVAEPLRYLGRWDEAVEVAERALDLAPPTLTRVGLWITCASIALARGDLATAVRRATACRTVLSGSRYDDQEHLPQAVLDIELSLATDGPAAAVDLAAETLARYDLSASSPRYVWPLLATAAAAARRVPGEAADALLCRLRTLAEKLEVSGPEQRAWQLWYAAIDPRADDDGAGAASASASASAAARLDAADAAVAAWEAIDQPYPAALALVVAAQVALAGGPSGREAAAARLRRAALLAEGLGARPLAEQIAALLLRATGTGNGARTEPERLGLTGRELEVLGLVTAGQSNREIAAALFISPKTASVHVSNILAKLGAATRTEAAARAHALHLFDAADASR